MKKCPTLIWGIIGVALTWSVLGEAEKDQSPPESSFIEKLSEEELRKRLKIAEESLALAQTEADYFHEKWVELRLKHEALGLEALTANEKALEEKLVKIFGELYRSEKQRKLLEDAILKLIEAGKSLRSAPPSELAEKRVAYEIAVRATLQLVKGGNEQPLRIAPDLQSGVVTKVDTALASNMAVVNFGRAQGAKVGMPFRILRGDQPVGRCRIAEVREYICAILIEEMIKNTQVQVGDRLLLETVN